MGQRCCKDLFGGGAEDDDDLNPNGVHYGAADPLNRNAAGGAAGRLPYTSSGSSMATQEGDSPLKNGAGRCPCGCGAALPCPRGVLPTAESRDSLYSAPDTARPAAGATTSTAAMGTSGGGKGLAAKKSWWKSLRTPRLSRATEPSRAPPKRASGFELLERLQVVCLLGSGAFGSVSLVIHRPPPGSAGAAGAGTGLPPVRSTASLHDLEALDHQNHHHPFQRGPTPALSTPDAGAAFHHHQLAAAMRPHHQRSRTSTEHSPAAFLPHPVVPTAATVQRRRMSTAVSPAASPTGVSPPTALMPSASDATIPPPLAGMGPLASDSPASPISPTDPVAATTTSSTHNGAGQASGRVSGASPAPSVHHVTPPASAGVSPGITQVAFPHSSSGHHSPQAATHGGGRMGGMPAKHRQHMLSADDVASLASSTAGSFAAFSGGAGGGTGGSFAHGSLSGSYCNSARKVRFSVLKRINKQLQAQMKGTDVDIAAERFRSAGLRHPFVLRLLEAAQTSHDYYNVYQFALGGDVGGMLSRRLSEVLSDITALGGGGENIATITRAVAGRSREARAPPGRCTCGSGGAQDLIVFSPNAGTPAANGAGAGASAIVSPSEQSLQVQGGTAGVGGATVSSRTQLLLSAVTSQQHQLNPAAVAAALLDPACPVAQWSATEGGLPLPTLGLIAFELLSAIQYLASHPCRITHGDLKPENVFIMENGHIVLGDFSMMTFDAPPAHGDQPPAPGPELKKRPSGLNRSFPFFGGGGATGGGGGSSNSVTHGGGGGSANGSTAGRPQSVHSTTSSHHYHSTGGQPSHQQQRDVERNPKYMPPEVVTGAWKPGTLPTESHHGGVREPVVDMWGYGVMLLQLATGVHPFFPPGTVLQSQPAMMALVQGKYEPIARPVRPAVVTACSPAEQKRADLEAEQVFDGIGEVIDLLNDLVRKCLRPDPARRITPSEAQHHSFFRHPLVLAHLGVPIANIAADAAGLLGRTGLYASAEAADAAFFVPDSDRINWPALDQNELLAGAFLETLWEYVLREGLAPQVVPRDVCVHGGYFIPEDVNLTLPLSGRDLIKSICQSSFSNFSFAAVDDLAARGGGGADARRAVAAVSPPPAATERSDLASPAPNSSSNSTTPGNRSMTNDAAGGASFGDPRLPPFCPVDLRFFATTQSEFDAWDDERNKRRLAKTDADVRAELQAAEELVRHATAGAVKGGKGQSQQALAFSADFLANYTYRGFDSHLFR